MSTCRIIIHDEDLGRDYSLEVEYDFSPAEKPTGPSYASGGEPGCDAHVECYAARCTEITTWCGDVVVSAKPANDPQKSLEKSTGEWCLSEYAEQIEREVMQAHEDECRRDDAAEARAEARAERLRDERGAA